MSGETSCYWALWFKSNFINYEKIPDDPELIKWRITHTRILDELRKERLAVGEKIFIEEGNRFSIEVGPGIFVEGKPDLVAISENDATIYDCKVGEQKASHQVQLMIYMYAMAHCLNKYPNLNVKGCLRYNQGNEVEIPNRLIDENFIKDLKYFAGILSAESPPGTAPSKNECRYCNITKRDCPGRLD